MLVYWKDGKTPYIRTVGKHLIKERHTHYYDDMNFTAQSLSTITVRKLVVHNDRDPFFPLKFL